TVHRRTAATSANHKCTPAQCSARTVAPPTPAETHSPLDQATCIIDQLYHWLAHSLSPDRNTTHGSTCSISPAPHRNRRTSPEKNQSNPDPARDGTLPK